MFVSQCVSESDKLRIDGICDGMNEVLQLDRFYADTLDAHVWMRNDKVGMYTPCRTRIFVTFETAKNIKTITLNARTPSL